MTNHRVLAVLLFVAVGAGASLGQATSGQSPAKSASNPFLRMLGNGAWWTGLPDDTKDTFVDGYLTAMVRVNHMIAAQSANHMQNLHPGPQFDAEWKAATALCVNANFFDFSFDDRLKEQKVRSGLDEFYRGAQNTRIPIDPMEYIKDVLKGKTAPRELEDQLKGWRSSLNE